METIDWLGLEISFDKSLKNKLYESQRQQEYLKWLRLLLDQRDAYRCFCKTKTCEGKCETSVENSDSSSKMFTENKDISFIKYKVREKQITVHDIITSQNFELETKEDSHFNLYHRISPDEYFLSSTFKRVIDDEIFKVTHKFELKNKYNFKRHLILTKYCISYLELFYLRKRSMRCYQ
jgi:glutamyl/glutaminyl-tRNA synthetase